MATRYQTDRTASCTCGLCPVHPGVAAPQVGREATVYEACKDGRLLIDDTGRIWRGGERAEYPKGSHYRISLRVRNRQVNTLAHRLVWFHFHGPIAAGLQVNHIDGDGFNNAPENLELATPAENSVHRYHKLGRTNLTAEGRAKVLPLLKARRKADARKSR